MASSLYKGQIPFRAKGQTTCIHHRSSHLDLYCEECQKLVCINCLSTVHKHHTMCKLSEITPRNIEDILIFIDKTENEDLVQIDQFISSTDKQLKDNGNYFEKISIQLRTQTNKLKGDLDLLAARTLSLYQQMEEDNAKLLYSYKQDLEMYRAQLKQKEQECKEALQRGSDIQIYDAGRDIRSPVTTPVRPNLGTASFSPNQNPRVLLEEALGEVSTSGQGQGQALLGHDLPAGTGSSHVQERSEPKGRTLANQQQSSRIGTTWKSPKHENSTGKEQMTSPVLRQANMLGKWKSPCCITCVCPNSGGQVWTSNFFSDTLTLLDRNGKVIQKVKQNAKISDISLSPTTNTLWVCDIHKRITELVPGRLVHRFSTRDEPQCICITASNHVIVGMDAKISKFTSKGILLLTTSTWGSGKPLVCRPHRISECPVTQNIAVADLNNTSTDGEKKCRVVVLDTDLKKLFVYNGGVPHTYQPASQSDSKPFNACGVVYDSMGNLVIADRSNNRILLISGRGEFLGILHTDDNTIETVGVDMENVLYAVDWISNVKLLQYSTSLDKTQCVVS